MKTIVVRYINRMLVAFLLISFAGEGFSFEGGWKTKAGVGLPVIYLCINQDGSLIYSEDEGFISSVHFKLDNSFEDISIFSLRKDGYVYRKLVLLDRSFSNEMIGQLHIYDGYKPINTIDVYLIRNPNQCRFK